MIRLIWSPHAVENLKAIRAHIARENPGAADRVARAIKRQAERLTRFPHLGQRGRGESARRLLIPRLPYFLFYEISKTGIEILRVRHTAMDRTVD